MIRWTFIYFSTHEIIYRIHIFSPNLLLTSLPLCKHSIMHTYTQTDLLKIKESLSRNELSFNPQADKEKSLSETHASVIGRRMTVTAEVAVSFDHDCCLVFVHIFCQFFKQTSKPTRHRHSRIIRFPRFSPQDSDGKLPHTLQRMPVWRRPI